MSAQERLRINASERQTLPAGERGVQPLQPPLEVKIGKAVICRDAEAPGVLAEIFTMTMGDETIELLPLRNWTQLDTFKWRVRGILPRTPAGLEISCDHLKIADETVSPWEPDACARLEKAFNEWLALERQTQETVKENARATTPQSSSSRPCEDAVHFEIDMGNAQQPRLKCLEGHEVVKVVALNLQGLNALIEQGFMHRPQALKVGALHDWIELDGEIFRFSDGMNRVRELEKVLNELYVVAGELDAPPDVSIFPNPASPTGFDIQFPATPAAVVENRKRHLNEETVQLLQDPERCRVLRKGITARLIAPNLIFKIKTPEGGERPLEPGPESIVSVVGQDGQAKTIDLSQPVNLLGLGVPELTAVFNHPAINRRAMLARSAKSGGTG